MDEFAGNKNSDADPNGFSELECSIGGGYGPSNSSRRSFTGKCLSSKANSKSRNSKFYYYMLKTRASSSSCPLLTCCRPVRGKMI